MFTISPESITVIPNAKGKPAGVLIDMQTWDSILEALELAEDLPVIKQALSTLKSAGWDPVKAGFIPWSSAREKLTKSNAKK
jgi:hypothetical protein